MISSPGCLCRKAGASGLISTRFRITIRPGTPRSCSCRSICLIPGTCCTVAFTATSVSSSHLTLFLHRGRPFPPIRVNGGPRTRAEDARVSIAGALDSLE